MTTLRIYLEVWCVFFFVCFFFRFLHLLVGRRFVAFPGLFLCLVIVKHLLNRFSLEVFIAISGERKKSLLKSLPEVSWEIETVGWGFNFNKKRS